MAIPAYLMDRPLETRIKALEDRARDLEDWVKYLIDRDKKLEAENTKNIKTLEAKIKKDIHEHVKKLVNQIQILENEIKSLKQ